VFNIATGAPTEIGVLAEIMGGEIQYIPRRGYEVECHQADLAKTARVLNWKAKIEFVGWLKEFVKDELKV